MGRIKAIITDFDGTLVDTFMANFLAYHEVFKNYGYLLTSKKLKNVDLSFIKTPIVGGDKMDYTLEKEVNQFLKEHH